MKTKQGLLQAVEEEIHHLQLLAKQIEASDEPDLRPVADLPEILKSRRTDLALSIEEVGDLSGVSATTVRAMEKGVGNPTVKSLQGVGEVLNFRLWIET